MLAIIMLGAIAYFYVNKIFLPVKVKAYIEEAAGTQLGRKVSVEKIDFDLLKGFAVHNIFLHKKDDENVPEFVIPHLSFNIIFADVIKTKTIIIPTIHINGPVIPIVYHEDMTFNFSDLVEHLKRPSGEKQYSVILKKLIIKNGKITFTDHYNEITETLSDLNLEISLSLNKKITFDGDTLTSQKGSSLKLTGSYDLATHIVEGNLNIKNILIDQYMQYLKSTSAPVLENALIREAAITFVYKNKELDLKGSLITDELTALIKDSFISSALNISGIDLRINANGISAKALIDLKKFNYAEQGMNRLTGDIKGTLSEVTVNKETVKVSSNNLIVKNLIFTPSENNRITTNLYATNLSFLKDKNTYSITGDYKLDRSDMTYDQMQYTGDLTLNKLNLEMKKSGVTANSQFVSHNTTLMNKAQSVLTGDISSDNLNISYGRTGLSVAAALKASDITAKLTEELTLTGSPMINGQVTYGKSLSYEGEIKPNNSSINGVAIVESISDIDGEISITNDKLTTKNLSLITQNTRLNIYGDLNDFKNPNIKANISTKELNLTQALAMAKPYAPVLNNIDNLSINGVGEASVNFIGRLKSYKDATIKVTLEPKYATLTLPSFKNPFEKLNGKITFDKSGLLIENLTTDHNFQRYQLNATFQNGETPTLTSTLDSPIFKAATDLEFHKDNIKIQRLAGHFYESHFTAKGLSTKDLRDPNINLDGQIQLDTTDLAKITPIAEHMKDLKLSGKARIKASMAGALKDWKNWNITAAIQSDELSIYDLPFIFVDLGYAQEKGNKSQVELTASLYKGSIVLLSNFEAAHPDLPFKLNGKITNLDLAEYRKAKNLVKHPHLSGQLTFYFDGFGPYKRRGDIEGKGYLAVTNGYLGQVIPYYKEAHFTDAQANFFLANGRLITSDGELFSDIINIGVNGWMDFEKNYNFQAAPKINDVIVSKSKNIKIDPSMLLRETINLSCSGTLPQSPDCKPHASPKKIINSTTDMIKEGIGTLIEGLL